MKIVITLTGTEIDDFFSRNPRLVDNLAPKKQGKKPKYGSREERAVEIINGFFSNRDEIHAADIEFAAAVEGIGRTTLYRAKVKIGDIVAERTGRHGWNWKKLK